MLVPIREYASAAEMLASLTAIRREFRKYDQIPMVKAVEPEAESEAEVKVKVAPVPVPKSVLPPIPMRPVANDNEDIVVPRRITVAEVIRAVSAVWEIAPVHLLSHRRHLQVMRPRKVAYALACRLTTFSLPHIGREIGNRDHTTVLSGCRKMKPILAAVDARIRPGASVLEWAQEMRKEMGG